MPRVAVRSEASIQRAVVEYARSKGCIAIKQSTAGRFGSSGWPDYLIFTPIGYAYFIEFKKPGGKVTALQAQRIEELRGHEISTHVCDDVVDGKEEVDNALRRAP